MCVLSSFIYVCRIFANFVYIHCLSPYLLLSNFTFKPWMFFIFSFREFYVSITIRKSNFFTSIMYPFFFFFSVYVPFSFHNLLQLCNSSRSSASFVQHSVPFIGFISLASFTNRSTSFVYLSVILTHPRNITGPNNKPCKLFLLQSSMRVPCPLWLPLSVFQSDNPPLT